MLTLIPYTVDIGAITNKPIRTRAFNQGLGKRNFKIWWWPGLWQWDFSPPVLWNNILIRLHKICIIGSTLITHYNDIIMVGTYVDSIVETFWFFCCSRTGHIPIAPQRRKGYLLKEHKRRLKTILNSNKFNSELRGSLSIFKR